MMLQKGFTLVEGLLIALIICFVGFAGWYVWDKNSKENSELPSTTETNENQKAGANSDDQQAKSITTTHDFVYVSSNGYRITLEHPETWKADTASSEAEDANPRNYIKLTGPEGHIIYVNDGDGIGFNCETELRGEVTYTVEDIINTQTDKVQYVKVKSSKLTAVNSEGMEVTVDDDSYYIPQNPSGSADEYPFAGQAVASTKTITYTDDNYGCSPLMGPKSVYDGIINIVVEKPGDQLSTFSEGIPKELLENQEIKAIIESLTIEDK